MCNVPIRLDSVASDDCVVHSKRIKDPVLKKISIPFAQSILDRDSDCSVCLVVVKPPVLRESRAVLIFSYGLIEELNEGPLLCNYTAVRTQTENLGTAQPRGMR